MTCYPRVNVGEPAPWFAAPTGQHQGKSILLDELAGRPIVLLFIGQGAGRAVANVLTAFNRARVFDDARCLLIIISDDPNAVTADAETLNDSAVLKLLDLGGKVTSAYIARSAEAKDNLQIEPTAFVLDAALQISGVFKYSPSSTEFAELLVAAVHGLTNSPRVGHAPVLVVPRVFDPALCSELIGSYQAEGGREIGSVEYGGSAVRAFDSDFRKRRDWYVSDDQTMQVIRSALERRLLPMVYRAFQFNVTRIERYLVGCYAAQEGGRFRAHRDNTAPLVAHRRFALTINLNEEFEGGHLRFPEFGPETIRSAPGDALVFSCSLLHEVTPITSGSRYAFLTFFYDEAAERVREQHHRAWIEAREPSNQEPGNIPL